MPSWPEQKTVVSLRTTLHNRYVEPVFGVSAVDDRLIVAAVLGFGEPVRAEGHLVRGQRRRGGEANTC